MAKIKPFKAIRPRPDLAADVSTLPYDIFTDKEARKLVSENPKSFLRIVRSETTMPKGTDPYSRLVYEKARYLLEKDIESGVLLEEKKECYYIYRQIMNDRSQTGIVACFAVDDYLNNIIKKHELTRHDKEMDRTNHIYTCNAQTGMVFMAFQEKYDLNDIIDKITLRKPLYDFVAKDHVRQIIWRVDDADEIDAITRGFAQMDSLYIADGHHRCASAASVALKKRSDEPDYTGEEPFNYILAVAFPQNQLVIYPYNRVMKNLNGLTDEEFLAALPEHGFDVEKVPEDFTQEEKNRGAYKICKKGEIGVYLSGAWYRLTAHKDILKDDAVGSLESSLLQDNILKPILGVEDIRADERVDFVGGVNAFEEIEKRCSDENDMKIGFALYPTTMNELFRITDEGKIMPPKSTWFEPKLQSGLLVHRI